jgi:hypothetical protein
LTSGQGHLPRRGELAAADHADIGDGVMGARKGRVVTTAVRPPVRATTRWIRVLSRASARLIAGGMVVRRRASIDFPAPGGPMSRRIRSNACMTFSFASASRSSRGLCGKTSQQGRAKADNRSENRRVGPSPLAVQQP